MTKVSSLFSGAPLTITPNETTRTAVERMHQHRVGALPVVDESGSLVGIISERDVIRCVVEGTELHTTSVQAAMSKRVLVALESDDIERAMTMMIEGRVRHLPVMRDGRLVGMIPMVDVVDALRSADEHELRYLRDYIYERR